MRLNIIVKNDDVVVPDDLRRDRKANQHWETMNLSGYFGKLRSIMKY